MATRDWIFTFSAISPLQEKSLETTLCFLHQVFPKFPKLPLSELYEKSFLPLLSLAEETRGTKTLTNEHNKTGDFSMDASFMIVPGLPVNPVVRMADGKRK